MKELVEILVGIAAFIGLVWFYLKSLELYERLAGRPPESLWIRWFKRRNRPTTVLGRNDENIL